MDYFSSFNFVCPELSNPSDYFMSIMSIESIDQDEGMDASAGDMNKKRI